MVLFVFLVVDFPQFVMFFWLPFFMIPINPVGVQTQCFGSLYVFLPPLCFPPCCPLCFSLQTLYHRPPKKTYLHACSSQSSATAKPKNTVFDDYDTPLWGKKPPSSLCNHRMVFMVTFPTNSENRGKKSNQQSPAPLWFSPLCLYGFLDG